MLGAAYQEPGAREEDLQGLEGCSWYSRWLNGFVKWIQCHVNYLIKEATRAGGSEAGGGAGRRLRNTGQVLA